MKTVILNNAVARPLWALKNRGVEVSEVPGILKSRRKILVQSS